VVLVLGWGVGRGWRLGDDEALASFQEQARFVAGYGGIQQAPAPLPQIGFQKAHFRLRHIWPHQTEACGVAQHSYSTWAHNVFDRSNQVSQAFYVVNSLTMHFTKLHILVSFFLSKTNEFQ
jgi:hypothetical protein